MPRDDDRGLGLLHMRERVEAMDGSFRLETEPTVGTKIAVTLSLAVLEGRDVIEGDQGSSGG